MGILFLQLCVVVYATIAVSLESKHYPRYIQMAGGDGQMHKVDLEAEPDMELIDEMTRNPANNQYFLYTKRNSRASQTLKINNAESIRNSNFNADVPTVVVVHGWQGNQYANLNPAIRNAYLDKSDVNVIIMDWRRLAMADYATAAAGAPAVGRGLGQFLAFLHWTTGAPYTSMHLVGFSLGAHIVGNAGRELNGAVARVTGLDPAGPLWNYNQNRIRASDGIYVEAIHTNGGVAGLGIGSRVADADFFVNGGTSQPGCFVSLCNHNRAWELFASTVTRNHLEGRACTTMAQMTLNNCRGDTLSMGNDILTKRGSGLYRVNTGRSYPF